MTKTEIREFFERLEGPEGCNFQGKQDAQGNLLPETVTWECAGGNDKTLSRAILMKMGIPEKEITAFLVKCHEAGGHCDCEIIFNAKERWERGEA